MFKILFGIVIGTTITLAALHPTDAKIALNKSIDALHSGYVSGRTNIEKMDFTVPGIPTDLSKFSLDKADQKVW